MGQIVSLPTVLHTNIKQTCRSLHILKNQEYDAKMICIDAFNKHCAIEPIKGKSDSDLALGLFECMNKMGNPPKT